MLKGYLHDGDLLVNSTGEGTVGRSLVFNSGDGFVADGHVTIMRFRNDEIQPEFVKYVINTPTYQEYLDAWFIIGATKQTELTAGRLQSPRFRSLSGRSSSSSSNSYRRTIRGLLTWRGSCRVWGPFDLG